MEEILILLFQGFIQIAFEILAYLPWDFLWYICGPDDDPDSWKPSTRKFWAAVASLIVGGLVGWATLHFFPNSLLHSSWLRLACLFLSPIASGLLGREMARWRAQRNPDIDPSLHFWVSLCFSIGLVWIRFAYANHSGW